MSHFIDQCLSEVDATLRTLFPPKYRKSVRPNPAELLIESPLTHQEKKHVAGLMRVNHAGEVCAQALYRGQASTAKLTSVEQQMQQAALEEEEHLAWCEQRLRELHSQPSILNPLWYVGAFLLGAFAGRLGDHLSLGFVAETERQVVLHLQKHLQSIPEQDQKTKMILTQMHLDEGVHAEQALKAGGIILPFFVQLMMNKVSKIMTSSSYYF